MQCRPTLWGMKKRAADFADFIEVHAAHSE